jgi:hypothetical protein
MRGTLSTYSVIYFPPQYRLERQEEDLTRILMDGIQAVYQCSLAYNQLMLIKTYINEEESPIQTRVVCACTNMRLACTCYA